MSAQPCMVASAPLRLGFIGLGWIGRKRLDAVAPSNVRVVALADAVPARLDAAASAYPDAAPVGTLDGILERDVDGVVIATPNGSHAELTIACLQRGVSVFCQKPLAVDAGETARIVAAARSANRLLGVDFCYRHVAGMSALRERILGGELGEIMSIELTFHNAYRPDKAWCEDRAQAGGGCLLDLGVHLLDLASWLQGSPRLELVGSQLFSAGRRLASGDTAIEDHACAQLAQANGAVVNLSCSWSAHVGQDALIGAAINGSKGGAAWRNVNGSFFDFTVEIFHGTGRERLGSHPDAWGPRALQDWIARLSRAPAFDEVSAAQFQATADLVDRMYGR